MLLFGKVKKVELNRDEILCTSKNGDVSQYSIKDIKYFPTLSKSFLGNGILSYSNKTCFQ